MQKTNIATTFAAVVLCLFGIAKSSDISFSAYVVIRACSSFRRHNRDLEKQRSNARSNMTKTNDSNARTQVHGSAD